MAFMDNTLPELRIHVWAEETDEPGRYYAASNYSFITPEMSLMTGVAGARMMLDTWGDSKDMILYFINDEPVSLEEAEAFINGNPKAENLRRYVTGFDEEE